LDGLGVLRIGGFASPPLEHSLEWQGHCRGVVMSAKPLY
jgi:hypothetical protein